MKWYSMCVEALPNFVPRVIVAERLPTVRSELKRQGFRCIGRCCSRDCTMWVRHRWYLYARLELFMLAALHMIIDFLYRQLVLTGPEGCYVWELRFNDPAHWRWK